MQTHETLNGAAVAYELDGAEAAQESEDSDRPKVDARREVEGQDRCQVDRAKEAEHQAQLPVCDGKPQQVLSGEDGDYNDFEGAESAPEAFARACDLRLAQPSPYGVGFNPVSTHVFSSRNAPTCSGTVNAQWPDRSTDRCSNMSDLPAAETRSA